MGSELAVVLTAAIAILLIALGAFVAVNEASADRDVARVLVSGLLAWLLWRTIYLGKLPGLERKVRVSIDWFVDLFFPRDIVLTSTAVPPGARRGATEATEAAARESTPVQGGADE